MVPITVGELVCYLQTLPSHLPVGYKLHSEWSLMQLKQITIVEAGLPRPDGWIHEKRSDKPAQRYVLFPGN